MPITNKKPAAGQRDAVCFTAGANGIAFGAGVVHAYLASDRAPPLVAAGISGGAINAAALQRCYQDLAKAKAGIEREIARWTWYRKYLDLLINEPMSVIWDGLPDQSDFYADMPPVKDPTPALFQNPEAQAEFERLELEARKELYLFVKAGNWLSRLPLSIGRIADLMVARVRAKENYPQPKTLRVLAYAWQVLIVFFVLTVHTAVCPQWFPERRFHPNRWHRLEFRRPLFGWITWSIAALISSALFGPAAYIFVRWVQRVVPWVRSRSAHPRLFVRDVWSRVYHYGRILRRAGAAALHFAVRHERDLLIAAAIVAAIWVLWRAFKSWIVRSEDRAYRWNAFRNSLSRLYRLEPTTRGKSSWWPTRFLTKQIFSSVKLESHLVHEFHLRIRLTRLFGSEGVSPKLSYDPMALVLVAAPLQKLSQKVVATQLWATEGTPLIDALSACVALPGLFSPLGLSPQTQSNWVKPTPEPGRPGNDSSAPERIDLVDGAVIRKNPIPALFMFLKRHPAIGDQLLSRREAPSIHVVYTHPVAGSGREDQRRANDIVDVGMKALRLQERRDTELEVLQTNFTAQLEEEIRTRTGARSPDVRNIYAGKICPEGDITFKNPMSPKPDELLKVTAQGCRRTMEALYGDEINRLAQPDQCVACTQLRAAVAPRRAQFGGSAGLPEVCNACTGTLAVLEAKQERPARESEDLIRRFPMLTGEQPRIILLASGGVFRGPFHAGMLACMLSAQIRPQMIVGASVGTLMGGALGALLTVPEYEQALILLGNIIDVFLHVDERIAFTRQFKSATRELGIRARGIRLSSAQIRNRIRKGSRSDSSFAIVGAPAPLIDAISELTMIPQKQTAVIAAQFVAGQVTGAVNTLLQQLKENSLGRLGISTAVIGTSLLEPTARTLLGEAMKIDLQRQQPFRNIGFFATTSDIGREECVILGRHEVRLPGSYDFVQAALASSAFPCIFSPRRESDVFPATGEFERQFSDGGMFDNLPFIPAIEVLADIQREHREAANLDSIEFLRRRHKAPDLFIVGSLDIRAEEDENGDGPFDNLIAITKRSKLLANNVKIRSFEDSSKRIHEQLELLLDPASAYRSPSNTAFVDGIVDAATMAVFPSDSDHLNPTFAFCRSTGFKPSRVRKSIADGCFQTFAKLIESSGPATSNILKTSMKGLIGRKIPQIAWRQPLNAGGRGYCPFFEHSAQVEQSQRAGRLIQGEKPGPFLCPFYAAWQSLSTRQPAYKAESTVSALAIYHECIADKIHKTKALEAGKETRPAAMQLIRADEILQPSPAKPAAGAVR